MRIKMWLIINKNVEISFFCDWKWDGSGISPNLLFSNWCFSFQQWFLLLYNASFAIYLMWIIIETLGFPSVSLACGSVFTSSFTYCAQYEPQIMSSLLVIWCPAVCAEDFQPLLMLSHDLIESIKVIIQKLLQENPDCNRSFINIYSLLPGLGIPSNGSYFSYKRK